MPPEVREAAAEAAALTLLSQHVFKISRKIACYLPFNSEFDTVPIIQAVWQSHKECFLPVLSSSSLKFISCSKGDKLSENRFGILEPVDNTEETPAEMLDLVILPMLAFDKAGYRLGTGGGFYDKTFAFLLEKPERRPLMVGLGFACQLAESLPVDEWDIKLDAALTEDGLQDFTGSLK